MRERSFAIAAGFDDFLRKPFKEAGYELLDRHLGVRFIYQDEAAHLQRGVPTAAVTDLSPVAPALRERLASSARIADMQNMLDVIKEIRLLQPVIAEDLGRLTQVFSTYKF